MAETRAGGGVGRRQFLAGAAAAATLTIVRPGSARGAEANSQLELGLIGSGGRGNWVAGLFQKNTQTKIVAAADYFQDRVNRAKGGFKLPDSRCHTGLDGYKKLLEGKLDAVAVESPPYFHPEQAAAAVEAGKHVYVAKPIAVDVPGCLTIGNAGKKATAKKLCFLVDFQTRANDIYKETVKRVHAGDIGTLALVQANYFTGPLGGRGPHNSTEARLRDWYHDVALSGDIIVEQNIHAIDVATWFINADPLKAVGRGGNRVRAHKGDCWDHFAVVFTFPDNLYCDFSSTQCTNGHSDIGCLVFGARGTAHTHYGGHVYIRGHKSFKGGGTGPIYTQGAVANMKTFWTNIQEGNVANETVAPSVRSNLTCVLGRTAARTGREVTWAEMMKTSEKLDPRLGDLKA
jgi:predicted dehydrogenase